jgi:hypothetical protein
MVRLNDCPKSRDHVLIQTFRQRQLTSTGFRKTFTLAVEQIDMMGASRIILLPTQRMMRQGRENVGTDELDVRADRR